MHRAWIAPIVALVAFSADAALVVRDDATVQPTAFVPVTLASSSGGTTTLGSSLTSASTSGAIVPGIGSVSVLRIVHGGTGWTARLELVSATGFAVTDSVTVSLVGATTQSQVIVSLGSVTKTTGTAVALPAAGPDITIVATGGIVGTATMTLRIVLVPPAATTPLLYYPYTLGMT